MYRSSVSRSTMHLPVNTVYERGAVHYTGIRLWFYCKEVYAAFWIHTGVLFALKTDLQNIRRRKKHILINITDP